MYNGDQNSRTDQVDAAEFAAPVTKGAECQEAVFSDNISDYSDASLDSPVVPGSATWGRKAHKIGEDAKKELNDILVHMKEFWRRHKDTKLPESSGLKPGYSSAIRISSYVQKASIAALIVSSYSLARYINYESPHEKLSGIRIVFRAASPARIKAYASIFVISLIVCVACVIIADVYSTKARKARDRLLMSLYEEAKIYSSLRPHVDYKLLVVTNMLRRLCESATTRVSYLEANDTGRAALMDAIERIQVKHKEEMSELREHTLGSLAKMGQDLQDVTEKVKKDSATAVSAVHNEISSLEQHIKSCERHFKSASEDVKRSSDYQTEIMRNILERGMRETVKKAEDLQDTVANFNMNMAFVIKSSVCETKQQVEKLLQIHLQNLNFISTLFCKENTAAVSVCIFMLKAYENIKKVHVLQSRGAFNSMKSELEYQVTGKLRGLLRETRSVNETISAVYFLLSVELGPIQDLTEELSAAITSGVGLSQHRETCSEIMKNCHNKMFGVHGSLKGDLYTSFCKKLYSALESNNSGAGDSVVCGQRVDALERLKSCAPFFMTIPHVMSVAMGIEEIHKTADDMYQVFKGVEHSFDCLYEFLPKSYTVPSNIEDPTIANVLEKEIACA